ncbi:uncharacterized protein LOC121920285 [Sceloporus undulatus]|uniref:uncharacterized protein LOC121920285 n=1 Tax=Sceloporus undulatus TaxID=8520 RepID=UPI001C4D73ED|nr:uncharacterized protein LOC121920285 [Sceloporus undulatus]
MAEMTANNKKKGKTEERTADTFPNTSKCSQGSSGTTLMQHPVIFSTHLNSSEKSSTLDHFHKLPKLNSCTKEGPSCLSTPSEICIHTPKDRITAVVNQTAVIPIDIDVTKSNWDFIVVHWHHIKKTDDDFLLKYDLRSCSQTRTGQQWWESRCHFFLEVMPVYRWKVSVMMNAWLIIWNVEEKDAGRYQVTVKSNNMKDACSFLELSVTRGSK